METQQLDKKLWTQQEVADYFRVVPATVKNWRERGYVCYFQVPGSTRVLYPVEAIKEFERLHTTLAKEVDKEKRRTEIKRKQPDVSATPRKEWRI